MSKAKKNSKAVTKPIRASRSASAVVSYDQVLSGMVELLESARHAAARSVNAIMTATYWEMGRRIVEVEQGGKERAGYGERLLEKLSIDLSARFGRGLSLRNLRSFRGFFLAWAIRQTPSAESPYQNEIIPTGQLPPDLSSLALIAQRFPLPWSAYVRLLSVADPDARSFYESEALRCGWSVRQLDRQIATLFYERTLLSRNKAAMLRKGEQPRPGDAVTPEEEIKDPLVLEFLGLKDALEGLPNKVLAAEYMLALPGPDALAQELSRTRKMLESHRPQKPKGANQ